MELDSRPATTDLLLDPSLRSCFPALAANPEVSYLDSASATQVPQRVLDAVSASLSHEFANPGRGSYPWASRAEQTIAAIRCQVASFIGADDPAEIAFVGGATAGVNAVAQSWAAGVLREGDEVLYSPLDHSSLVLPWVALQQALAERGRRVRLVPFATTPWGEADTDDIAAKVSRRTRLIVASHVHGVFGARTTLRELRGLLPAGTRVLLDCSQSAGHVAVDVRELDADFLTFSGQKVFGLPGTGVLYCRRDTHPELSPFLPGGGDAVRLRTNADGTPTLEATALPGLLEGGSPNTPGIVALGAGLAFVAELGIEHVAEHNRLLTRRLIEGLAGLPRIEFLPGVARAACEVGYGILSFAVRGERAEDVGFALASLGCFVRAGRHCLTDDRVSESVRVSVHAYTTTEDVDRFVDAMTRLTQGGA